MPLAAIVTGVAIIAGMACASGPTPTPTPIYSEDEASERAAYILDSGIDEFGFEVSLEDEMRACQLHSHLGFPLQDTVLRHAQNVDVRSQTLKTRKYGRFMSQRLCST